jgi:hypothetical protein
VHNCLRLLRHHKCLSVLVCHLYFFHFHLLINQPSNSTVQRTFAALSPLTFGVGRQISRSRNGSRRRCRHQLDCRSHT